MHRDLELYAMIAAEDTPAFSAPTNWYSNGQRGHLHASRGCEKIRRKDVIVRAATLGQALTGHTVCPDCIAFSEWDDERRRVLRSARVIHNVERSVGAYAAPRFHRETSGSLDDLRIRCAYERLSAQLDQIEGDVGLTGWEQRVRRRIDVAAPPPPSEEDLEAAALRAAIPRLLHKQLHGQSPRFPWGGREALRLFGEPALRDFHGFGQVNPLVGCVNRWTVMVHNGDTPELATARILGDGGTLREILGEPTGPQLARCRASGQLLPTESVWDYASRTWQEEGRTALAYTCAELSATFHRLSAPQRPVLLANKQLSAAAMRRRAVNDGDEDVIAASQRCVGVHGQDRSVLICHPTVAAFLSYGDVGSYSSWEHPLEVDEVPDTEALETALTLWDPRGRGGVYETFSGALNSALVL